MRRAFALISVTVMPGVSSIITSKLEIADEAAARRGQSSGAILAERMDVKETRDDAAKRRCAISVLLISSEKNATLAPLAAACTARLSAKEVLPTPGRAPTTIICPGRKPKRAASTEGKPVSTPSSVSDLFAFSASSRYRFPIMSEIGCSLLDTSAFVTSKMSFCAASTTSFVSSGAS